MKTLYTFTPPEASGPEEAYDRSIILACLQGIINRNAPCLYVIPGKDTCQRHRNINVPSAAFWLEVMRQNNRWLSGCELISLDTLDEVFDLAGDRVKGIVVWDTAVPATLNLATTHAGLED